MYYKKSSKVNWPVIITVGVIILFIIMIIGILTYNFIKSKEGLEEDKAKASTAIPTVNLSLNTEEPNQTQVLIKVNILTTDPAGLARIIIPGTSEIKIEEENQKQFETTFAADQNAIYEIQAYGKNGVFGSGRVTVSNIKTFSAREPYIPEGFTKDESTDVNKGLIIKDSFGNEYVWIPVPGGRLVRNRSETDAKYYEVETEAQFRNSVAKYQGFYIARFEAVILNMDGKQVAGSRPNVLPANRVTFTRAEKLAREVAEAYNYNGYQTALTSSSAWDTTLDWIDKSLAGYSSSINYGNYSGSLYNTGSNDKDEMANIYDLAGNLREWTSESYRLSDEERRAIDDPNLLKENEDQKILRGGSASNSSTPNRSTRAYPNSAYEHTGFRFILYKD